MFRIIKYTAVSNINVELESGQMITLHREVDFLTEEEALDYVEQYPEIEFQIVPFWAE